MKIFEQHHDQCQIDAIDKVNCLDCKKLIPKNEPERTCLNCRQKNKKFSTMYEKEKTRVCYYCMKSVIDTIYDLHVEKCKEK